MESKEKVIESCETISNSEEVNGLLLKELINSSKLYLETKKISQLSECIKKIFFSRLKIFDREVSKVLFKLHQIEKTPVHHIMRAIDSQYLLLCNVSQCQTKEEGISLSYQASEII